MIQGANLDMQNNFMWNLSLKESQIKLFALLCVFQFFCHKLYVDPEQFLPAYYVTCIFSVYYTLALRLECILRKYKLWLVGYSIVYYLKAFL